jgi:hypothetical protein
MISTILKPCIEALWVALVAPLQKLFWAVYQLAILLLLGENAGLY